MRHWLLAGAIGTLLVVPFSSPAQAQKPPKHAVAFDADVGPTSGGVTELTTVTLRRYRRGRILRVEMALRVDAGVFGGEVALIDAVRVNGATMPFQSTFCVNTSCLVEGSTFVDLDTLAAANPDAFKGRPLVVSIIGRAEWNGGATLRRLRVLAHLVRK